MKPEIILLVGMQGCGKSTFAKKYCGQYPSKKFKIISQDNQGKNNHFSRFKDAIINRENIIIDRINHTQFQRNKYLNIAKENNYYCKIVTLNKKFKTCIRRVLSRKNHPSFNPTTYKEASKAMYQFVKGYEPPILEECDEIINETEFDPYCLDISSKFSNFIVIGDVHGCYDELNELLLKQDISELLQLPNTAVVFVGDLIDKGPKSKEVLNWFFNMEKKNSNYFCIRGNHEYKLQRYLRGNSVEISHGLKETIEQCNLDFNNSSYDFKYAQFLLEELDSLPFMIKIANNAYITHAGINPSKHILRQPKEYLLFARTYNPITHSFNTPGDAPWFEKYPKSKPNIYFGHQFFEQVRVKDNVFCLDGYCVYGQELRAAIVKINSKHEISSQKFVKVEANKKYYVNEGFLNTSFLNHFDELTLQGYLKKSRKEDLVLYNYTQKTMYEKNWTSATMQARGLIFDTKNNELVARPFGKFFNINENELTQLHNLPLTESFEVFEKIDGVLGIIFFYNNEWQLTTRGEFDSIQAQIGQELLKSQIDTSKLNTAYTYLCEIIHPKCEIILSSNKVKKLILIGAIETKTGSELNYPALQKIAKKSGFEIVSKINLNMSIKEIYEDKSNWSSKVEGYVIRFESGLRVKIKSDAYISLVELKNNMNVDKLVEFVSINGKINPKYFVNIPEELEKNIIRNAALIELQFSDIIKEIEEDIKKITFTINNDNNSRDKEITYQYLSSNVKLVGEIIYKDTNIELNHPNILLPWIKKQNTHILKYIKKEIKRRIGQNHKNYTSSTEKSHSTSTSNLTT